VSLETAKALQAKCATSLEEDPLVEVGKVIQLDRETWFFAIYVIRAAITRGTIRKVNYVSVSPLGVEVLGPDEKLLGEMLRGVLA
jgi:hypothetical protein